MNVYRALIASIVRLSVILLVAGIGYVYIQFEALKAVSITKTEISLKELQQLERQVTAEESEITIQVVTDGEKVIPENNEIKATLTDVMSVSLSTSLEKNNPDVNVKVNDKGEAMITNPDSVLVLVNKHRTLPAGYTPTDLVVPNVEFAFDGDHPKKKMRKQAAEALERLFKKAKEDGIELKAISGYRSYAIQEAIYNRMVTARGEELAGKYSAQAGRSEHQTGLAMDVSGRSSGFSLVTSFGETEEGEWLQDQAPDFGFIIRYPTGKENVTGYSYEPWHIRYVGTEASNVISSENMSLEELLGLVRSETEVIETCFYRC